MDNRHNLKTIFIGLIVVLLLTLGWFFYQKQAKINYLIPGVPYNGIYNLIFPPVPADSPKISSVMDILGYWGDERFDIDYVRKRFPMPPRVVDGKDPENSTRSVFFSLGLRDVEQFFRDNGYNTEFWFADLNGSPLDQVRKFVNPRTKIPLIVYQKYSFDPASDGVGFRVAIGVFDDRKIVVVHDHDRGNNFEISFDDFTNMFPRVYPSGVGRAMLAVWPGESLTELIKGPNYDSVYPARTANMDQVGELLGGKGADMMRALARLDFDAFFNIAEEMEADSNFGYLPTALKVMHFSLLAQIKTELGQHDKAIDIIKEKVLPINHDLKQVPEGWAQPPADSFSSPYTILSYAYLQKGDRQSALESYNQLLVSLESYNKNYDINPLFQSQIDALAERLGVVK